MHLQDAPLPPKAMAQQKCFWLSCVLCNVYVKCTQFCNPFTILQFSFFAQQQLPFYKSLALKLKTENFLDLDGCVSEWRHYVIASAPKTTSSSNIFRKEINAIKLELLSVIRPMYI
jgi:hypothetical protein